MANAPHVPVHLGAMGESVRTVIRERGGTLRPGDVVALNNPYNGGTHLPDVTVITPVFDAAGRRSCSSSAAAATTPISAALTPGSTPPISRTLEEEGVVIDDFLLVEQGRFREAEFRALLASAQVPGAQPGRERRRHQGAGRREREGRAGAAARGRRVGLETVRAYMRHVMDNAEESVRRVLDRLQDGAFQTTHRRRHAAKVAVRVDRADRRATIDFTGTGPQRPANFNAPAAVCRAVVLYCFRALVGEEIPLNDGCLKPLEIIVPPGTFLRRCRARRWSPAIPRSAR